MLLTNLIKRTELPVLVKKIRSQQKTIVFTNGVFDILHRGHVEYLSKAKELGDLLIVGVNSDASVRRLKGRGRPIQKQTDRAAILLALQAVDYVVIFGEDTPEQLIKTIKPDILVKGADYQLNEIVGADIVQSYGGTVKRIRLTRGKSTTNLVKEISKTKY